MAGELEVCLTAGQSKPHGVNIGISESHGITKLTGIIEDAELLGLVRTARHLYQVNREQRWTVEPAAPVLFFGDLLGFEASQFRVATVGLNPSRHEFPMETPFSRFPGVDLDDESSYLSALLSYFQFSPYKSWFEFYERAMLGMEASFYGGTQNVALHTDIGSVIPTDPTWSALDASIRRRLIREGVPLWHRLIERLRPDVLLQSTARRWLELIEFTSLTGWERIHTFELTKDGGERKRPIGLDVCWFSLSTGKSFLIAHVPASQKPLAGLSHDQKRHAGEMVKERWRHGV